MIFQCCSEWGTIEPASSCCDRSSAGTGDQQWLELEWEQQREADDDR